MVRVGAVMAVLALWLAAPAHALESAAVTSPRLTATLVSAYGCGSRPAGTPIGRTLGTPGRRPS
jgi:hypothetical protein